MRFSIDEKIFQKLGGLTVALLVAKDLNNSGDAEGVMEQIRQEEERIRKSYSSETLSQHPKIDVWRKAYQVFSGKPKENKPSVENLYRRVLKGEGIRSVNKLVDCYNLISLRHMLPAGGEDCDRMKGSVQLTLAGPSEPPVLLLGEKEPRPPKEGEVIYKDEESALCRRLNWKEADRTKLTEDTKNALLVIEAMPPITREELENAAAGLKSMVEEHCKAKVELFVLDSKNPQADF